MDRSWGHSGPSRAAGHCPRPPRSRVITILGVAHPSAVWECRVNVRAPDTPCLVPASLSVEPRSGLASGADPSQRAGKGSLVLPSAACTPCRSVPVTPVPCCTHARGSGRVPRARLAGARACVRVEPACRGAALSARRSLGPAVLARLLPGARVCALPSPWSPRPSPAQRWQAQDLSSERASSSSLGLPPCRVVRLTRLLSPSRVQDAHPRCHSSRVQDTRPHSVTCIVTVTAVSQLPAHLLTLAGSPVFELNVFHF